MQHGWPTQAQHTHTYTDSNNQSTWLLLSQNYSCSCGNDVYLRFLWIITIFKTYFECFFWHGDCFPRKASLHPGSVGNHCILDPRNKTRNSDKNRFWWLGTVQSPGSDSVLDKAVLILADQRSSNFSLGKRRENKVTPLVKETLDMQTAEYR